MHPHPASFVRQSYRLSVLRTDSSDLERSYRWAHNDELLPDRGDLHGTIYGRQQAAVDELAEFLFPSIQSTYLPVRRLLQTRLGMREGK